ncbi:hypothetical protein, partial [Sphingomonas asaccharolytica]|uniref:hypothetical protein n=1 Tax=Sphingomonas asaccharolytica TaxID=40681 RepID=UPI001C3F9F89
KLNGGTGNSPAVSVRGVLRQLKDKGTGEPMRRRVADESMRPRLLPEPSPQLAFVAQNRAHHVHGLM